MKFRLRVLVLVAVTIIGLYTYVIVVRTDFKDASENVNDYIDIHDSRMDEWDLGPDPKWVKAAHSSYNNVKSTVSRNESRPRARRLTVSERVNKYINMYRPKWNHHLNVTSPWSIAAKWVTSRQIVGVDATELGRNNAVVIIFETIFFFHLLDKAS